MLTFPAYVIALGNGTPYRIRTDKGRLLPVFTSEASAVSFLQAEGDIRDLNLTIVALDPNNMLGLLQVAVADFDFLAIDVDRSVPYMTTPIASAIAGIRQYLDGLDKL